MIETTEIVQTIEHLQRTFEDLMLRGLRAAGPGEINTLNNIREECERIGAYHLAGRVQAIVEAIQSGSRNGADALMRAQTSLRMFDRILTLENAHSILSIGLDDEVAGASDHETDDEEDDDEDDDA